MKGDILNYRRARTVSLLGLILQAVIAVALAVYTAFSGGTISVNEAGLERSDTVLSDHAALTATVYAALGVVVWLTLAFLYDWHRRERQEAIEAERLAADPAGSAFDGAGDEIRVAARRLAGFQKFGLPIVSLSVGTVLLVVGGVRLAQGQAAWASDEFDTPLNRGLALVVGIGVAFVGFVFARFVAGMAKQPVWSSLRAGASYAVGSALLGLAIAVAQFITLAGGPETVLRALQVAFPVFMIVMGAEVFLNFVLDLYRPRKAGEDPRAAFDSRLLGLLAAPDKIAENIGEAINYQFGVEVSQTWFYRLLSRWWLGLVMLVLVVMWAMSSLVVIEPHQRALILTFGEPRTDESGMVVAAEPGLHLKWPWPIGEVYIPTSVAAGVTSDGEVRRTVTGLRKMELGTNPPRADTDILWTNDHVTGEEYFNLVHPSPFRTTLTSGSVGRLNDGDDRSDNSFADLSLVAIELPVHWVVDDVFLYDTFAAPGFRERLLQLMGQRKALQLLSERTIDEVLGAARTQIAETVRDRLESIYGSFDPGPGVRPAGAPDGAGVRLVFVGAGNVHPPKDVAPNFERVVQSQQIRQSKIESARREAIEILTEVAAVGTDEAGERVDASAVVRRIEDLEALRASGASEAVIAAEALAIQRMLEASGGDAGATLILASASRWQRHMGERARAILYQGQLAGYEAAPGLYMAQTYFDALATAMRDVRVYLLDDLTIDTSLVRFNLEDRRETNVFDAEAGGPGS